MKQKIVFMKDGYAERVEKLLEDLRIAEISSADTAPIVDSIEKEIAGYCEYLNDQKRPACNVPE